jgi:hypothetical protein
MGRSQPDSVPEVTGSESRSLSVVMAKLPVFKFKFSAPNPCRRGGRDFTKLCTWNSWLSSLPHAVESSASW